MKNKFLKILKILVLGISTLILITVATVYFSLNEKLPKDGISGPEADAFAKNIMKAVNHENYLNTKFIQWTFRNKNHYLWNKPAGRVEVKFDEYKVDLNLNAPSRSSVYQNDTTLEGTEKKKIIKKALDNFNNDSFWVVAPHKLFDTGVTRKLVTLEDNNKGLLVSYSSGGTTPGDSYLWKVDKNYRPTSYQMWVSIIPIGGIEATWDGWITTDSGAYLSQKHELLGFGIPISNLKAWNE